MVASEVTITLSRTEAVAPTQVAEVGLRVVEAPSLIQSTTAAEKAISAINHALAAKR